MNGPVTQLWTFLWTEVRTRWNALQRDPDAGYSTETVIVTALLVVAAIVVIGIIVAKVTAKANGIVL
jgi:hypothetical protein